MFCLLLWIAWTPKRPVVEHQSIGDVRWICRRITSDRGGENAREGGTVLSNCSFDRGTLCPTYSSPFNLLVRGNKAGDWLAILDEFRNFLLRTA